MKRYIELILLWTIFLSWLPSANSQVHSEWGSAQASPETINQLINESNRYRHGLSNTDTAIIILYEALRRSKQIGFNEGSAGALLCLAFCYQDKGAYRESKALLFRAYPYCIKAAFKNTRLMPSLYNGLAATYSYMGENDSALYYYYEAFKEMDKMPKADSQLLLQVYNNIGTAWMQKHELEKGLDYQEKAAKLARHLQDTLFLASIYSNIGTIKLERSDTTTALAYLDSALLIYQEKQNIPGLKFTYYALGNAQRDQAKAIAFFRAALQYDSQSAFSAGVYQGLGKAYYLSADYARAEQCYLQSQHICEREGLYTQRLANYSALSAIYSAWGRYQEAYTYQVAYANLNDSLLNTEKVKSVTAMELKYKALGKERELAENKVLLYRQQRTNAFILIGAFVFVAAATGIGYHSRQRNKLQEALIRNMEQEQRMNSLHAKMQGEEEERSRIARELHDGVNVLLSATKMNYAALGKVYPELPATHDYQEIMQLLNDIGTELRTITYKLVPELLIHQSLPDAVETFCELIQKGDCLHIEVQTYGSFSALPAEFCFGVYRIVQELIHNIVKHAGATQVVLVLSHQDNLLHLTVEDNGEGFTPGQQSSGLGLKSVHRRVSDLGGDISFSSQQHVGTTVEIEIVTTFPEKK